MSFSIYSYFFSYNFFFFCFVFKILLLIIPLLISIAYFTLIERKLLSIIQRRKGPNVIGLWGLLQPLADGLKLFVKETIIPNISNKFIFIFAPILTFIFSILSWAVIPITIHGVFTDLNLSILYLLTISSLGIYGIILSGWSSNSKYAFLGSLRSTAQMISYEISIGFILVIFAIITGSLNIVNIILCQKGLWFIFSLFPLFIIFCVSALAETNRHPFDLPEAEAELVSGYNVEYSAMGFALFFLGEYANMLLMSSLIVNLFLGGCFLFSFKSSFFFSIKLIFCIYMYIYARAILPRYRYDQLMLLGWTFILPITIAYIIFISGILISFNWLP